MAKIALFVPVYNEEETLEEVLSQVPRPKEDELEMVITDDGSTDRSGEIARRFTPHVITAPQNEGVGAATKRGFEYIVEALPRTDFVVKLDGDGQHDPRYIPRVFNRLKSGKDLVICSRFHPDSDQSRTPIDRIFLNADFTHRIRRLTGWNITDARSGFMGLPFRHVKRIAPKLITREYGIPMEIVLRLWKEKPQAKISEIPHPPLYGPGISEKLDEKYDAETLLDHARRLAVGYFAFLSVINDLGVPRKQILTAFGLSERKPDGA